MSSLWMHSAITALIALRAASATTCLQLPYCNRVQANSIYVVGVPTSGSNGSAQVQEVRFHVEETFVGLSEYVKELTLKSSGYLLIEGHRYLLSLARTRDGAIFLHPPSICGGSVEEAEHSAFLQYLRLRASGKAPTSITVQILKKDQVVPQAMVAIRSVKLKRRRRTSADGSVTFNGTPPGRYKVTSSGAAEEFVEVSKGACAFRPLRLQ